MSGPVNDKDVAEQIAKLYELHKSGALTESEFENAKQRVLGGKPPRRVAQPPPVRRYEEEPRKEPRPVGKVLLIIAGLIAVLAVIGALSPDDEDDDSDVSAIPTSTSPRQPVSTPLPTKTPEPTATAIPRTGIQTIRLTITVDGDWQAWGQGCVGGGDTDWANSRAGVVIAPEDASGTFQGQTLGAGTLGDENRCHWSAKLTSRASDAYRIRVGDYDTVCHSNKMMPTDDGFFAAVVLDEHGVNCATVVDAWEGTGTPPPTPTN